LARELNADIYTTNIDEEKIKKMGFKDIIPKINSIGKIPLNPPWRQELSFIKFRKLNLKGKYDFFIICGEWAIPGVVNNKPNIWYAHSTIRELWDLNEKIRKKKSFKDRLLFDIWTLFHRKLNKKYLRHVGKIVCNSDITRKRIIKYLHNNAKVIYPPIETKNFAYGDNKGFWLSVNRLLPPKRVEMQLKAFKKLPKDKLIIVGSYEKSCDHFEEYLSYLNKIKPNNVEILHWVDYKKVIELYGNCKAFITTPIEEDFGMTAIEAMASGKPVIAPDSGGYKESVIDRETGLLIKDIDENKLVAAIKKISNDLKKNPDKYRETCINQAKKFDTSIFIKKIKENLNER
jgi:glycosyltransferase involved in cell wall biosynthesis